MNLNGCVKVSEKNILDLLFSKETDVAETLKAFNNNEELILNINVSGGVFDDFSITSSFAKGLMMYQSAFNKAIAVAIYDTPDAKKLTAEQLDAIKLVFRLKKGSLDLTAHIETILEKIGLDKMSEKSRLLILFAIIFAISICYIGDQWFQTHREVEVKKSEHKLEQTKIDAEKEKEKEKTKQFQIFADAIKNATQERGLQKQAGEIIDNINSGERALIRGAEGASSIKIGSRYFDEDEIRRIQSRSEKTAEDALTIEGKFSVQSVKWNHDDGVQMTVVDSEGKVFKTTIVKNLFAEEEFEKIFFALKDRKLLEMKLKILSKRKKHSNVGLVQIV